ncbi:MAG: DUF4416 family protein [Leptospiraceae bacterium]|nr:DUF4416 family protein [Leptospiraceae bacterium]MDW7975820.1 DUF4416 family protein [Leptospiraceae bacterium]
MNKRWKPPFEKEKLARLFIVAIYDEENQFRIEKFKEKFQNFFGKIDFELNIRPLLAIPSNYISNKEYGIFHLFSFERPISREEIVDIKYKVLKLENHYQKEGFPIIELDVGYVTEIQAIRTTISEDIHRIYLYKKIYSETLYFFDKNTYKPFIHTPKFYRSPDIITLFNDLRLIYVSNIPQ